MNGFVDSFIILYSFYYFMITWTICYNIVGNACVLFVKPMFYFNIPRENMYDVCMRYRSITRFKMSGSKTFFCFCSRFQQMLIWKISLVYSDNIISSWLFLEVIPSTIYLQKIRNRWCLLEFRTHQKFDFFVCYFLFDTKILPLIRIWLVLCFS